MDELARAFVDRRSTRELRPDDVQCVIFSRTTRQMNSGLPNR